MKIKMEIFSRPSFILLIIVVSLFERNVVAGNLISTCGGIFEGDSGEFEYHGQNSNVNAEDDATGSSVCVWMIKLLTRDGAGVRLKLEDLDENSGVNFYSEGEPTNPVNTPITLNSTQINTAVELSGQIFIITLKSQSQLDFDQFETPATKFVLSWSSLEQPSNTNTDINSKSNSSKSKVLAVEFTSTNYFAAGGEKGRYNFKNFRPLQKSVWILDAGAEIGIDGDGSLNAQVNVEFDSSCLSKLKSSNESKTLSSKVLCECSYFSLFEIVPSTGNLRSVNENCGRSGSLSFTNLSTKLVAFVYATNPNSGSAESVQISWERNKEVTTPTTTTQSTEPEPPIQASICPDAPTIYPCRCSTDSYGVRIWCYGASVNQTIVENSFGQLRRVNGIPEDRGVEIYQMGLESTNLTQFNLAPLYGSRVHDLNMLDNYNLTKWVTSGNPQDHGSIHVDRFYLWSSPVNVDDFGDTFKYFSVQMTTFSASNVTTNPNNNNNNNNADELELEFFPGLSAFVNLTTLELTECNISGRLSSSHFSAFPKLEQINLGNNKIDGIGENVFSSKVWYIVLSRNKLDETSFHPESGIAQAGRYTVLYLSVNQITSLPSEIFQTFLEAHPQNYVYLADNPLVCDERLSWLKSRQEEFQSSVSHALCSNDEGHDVFDSDCIP